MHVAAKSKIQQDVPASESTNLSRYVPEELTHLGDPQTAIPRIAKDPESIRLIERAVHQVPTSHSLHCGDAREMSALEPNSVHLVLTSPPYWTLKEYRDSEGQLVMSRTTTSFSMNWTKSGTMLPCVGSWRPIDLRRRRRLPLAKRKRGRHTVVPLHASIQEHCRKLGYDNSAPIIWHKISNAAYEVEGTAPAFLGKPYEPNAVIKNDIEFILMERKPGGYRAPDISTKVLEPDLRRRITKSGFSRSGRASRALRPSSIPLPIRSNSPKG